MPTKTCFVIAPIGDSDSDTRKRSDQVLKHIITPAVKERGYDAIRADQISEPGMITSQVIQHIVDDPLVVADLTDRNPNVFYELAVRHALRKPLVQIIRKGDAIPFDVAGMRTIPVDHKDLDSVEEAKKDIIKQIDATEKAGSRLETPISVAVELQTLRQSDDPQQRSIADLLSLVGELRSMVANVDKRISNPEAILPPQYIEWALRHASRPPERPAKDFVDLFLSKDQPISLNVESEEDRRRFIEFIRRRSLEETAKKKDEK